MCLFVQHDSTFVRSHIPPLLQTAIPCYSIPTKQLLLLHDSARIVYHASTDRNRGHSKRGNGSSGGSSGGGGGDHPTYRPVTFIQLMSQPSRPKLISASLSSDAQDKVSPTREPVGGGFQMPGAHRLRQVAFQWFHCGSCRPPTNKL